MRASLSKRPFPFCYSLIETDVTSYPILDTRISFVWTSPSSSVTLRVPLPLKSETGWTGELWSYGRIFFFLNLFNLNLLNHANLNKLICSMYCHLTFPITVLFSKIIFTWFGWSKTPTKQFFSLLNLNYMITLLYLKAPMNWLTFS